MTLVFAHRGLHERARENTLEAFRAAVALGVDGVELDVRRCAEGDLVVNHDAAIAGRPLHLTPAAELPPYVATLAEALDACAGVTVNVEIKNIEHRSEPTYDATGDFARQVVDLLVSRGLARRAQLSCFDLATCVAARARDPGLYVAWLRDRRHDARTALARVDSSGLSALNAHLATVDASVMADARERGLAVNVWTVNRRRDLAAMLDLGVDGVITDEPAAALDMVKGPGGGPAAMA
jgi:glycerophosphoryl diester phosphodiesterase